MTSAIEVQNLTKSYGTHRALDGVSFTIPHGTTCALVGPNGAGKTTLIGVLLGLLGSDAGMVTIQGTPVSDPTSRKHLGYVPDVPVYPGWMKATEVLDLACKLSGQTKAPDHLLDYVGLGGVDRPVRTFSRGMTQRLSLAQALITAPDVLILDEPTSALDPAGRRFFHDIVQSLRGKATVLYSTHSLGEAEQVCDDALILHEGSLLYDGAISSLVDSQAMIELDVGEPVESFLTALNESPWVRDVQVRPGTLRLRVGVRNVAEAQAELPRLLSSTNTALHSFSPVSLEEIFLDMTSLSARRV